MPKRQDCKQFESRTYPNGETVRKCDLDLAPEAPWRCPEDCPKYTRRRADGAWDHGTLVTAPPPARKGRRKPTPPRAPPSGRGGGGRGAESALAPERRASPQSTPAILDAI